jgi:hypothetical protein
MSEEAKSLPVAKTKFLSSPLKRAVLTGEGVYDGIPGFQSLIVTDVGPESYILLCFAIIC